MLKTISWMFVAVMLVFAMTMVGCSNADTGDQGGNDSEENQEEVQEDIEEPQTDPEQEEDEDQVKEEEDFELIRLPKDMLPEMTEWMENHKEKEGLYRFEETNLYLIAAGEKPTGGFSLEIVEESLEDGVLTLHYKLQAPGPDDMVTQALTYPVIVFEVLEDVEYEEVEVNEMIE